MTQAIITETDALPRRGFLSGFGRATLSGAAVALLALDTDAAAGAGIDERTLFEAMRDALEALPFIERVYDRYELLGTAASEKEVCVWIESNVASSGSSSSRRPT